MHLGFDEKMSGKRNIFLEAAFAGKPVLEQLSEIENMQEQEKNALEMTKKIESKKTVNKIKPNKAQEMAVIEEAVQNVGRLPTKVLRYVELMAIKLGPHEKAYYSSVGTVGGASREAARRRISRKIKEM